MTINGKHLRLFTVASTAKIEDFCIGRKTICFRVRVGAWLTFRWIIASYSEPRIDQKLLFIGECITKKMGKTYTPVHPSIPISIAIHFHNISIHSLNTPQLHFEQLFIDAPRITLTFTYRIHQLYHTFPNKIFLAEINMARSTTNPYRYKRKKKRFNWVHSCLILYFRFV